MKILLIAMPDAANNFFRMVKIPNLGLCSIAAQLKNHDVKIIDLVLVHKKIRSTLKKHLAGFQPDIVGISSMSFQYQSARQVSKIVREFNPETKIALGGYHATMQYESVAREDGLFFDFIVRGEGETTFQSLVESLAKGSDYASIRGLSYLSDGRFIHNPPGDLLNLETLPFPERSARVLKDFTYLKRKMDAVETSRGCRIDCNFCSINKMYGKSYRCHTIERVVEDLSRLKKDQVESVLFVDDNITLNVPRLKNICEAIIQNGLNTMEYFVQASVTGIASDPELVEKMAQANFRLVFLGIESVQKKNLKFFRKGDIREKTVQAVDSLRKHEIAIMGGFIIGNPDDTREDVREVFQEAKRLKIDLAMVQCLTPYPNTILREELARMDLITNEQDFSRYTGFMCNVRTRHLSTAQLNRLMNWENIKMFFHPSWFVDNNFVKKREKGSLKVMLNNFEYIRGWFTGDQFRSRHKF